MLDVKDLHVRFHKARGNREAVQGIDLHMDSGEILGLVGESGSGKTVTAMTISGLMNRSQSVCTGEIWLDGVELLSCDREQLRKLQGRDIGVVFQEPMSSMNPVMRIGPQIEESLHIHTTMTPAERKERALYVMAAVELPEPEAVYEKYPHELSGGMLQRAMIAAALATRPKLLLCDEPTTALDVTIQAQILELLKRVNREFKIGILFISHDLNVVRKLCTRVAVMYQGKLVEEGPVDQVFYHPQHEYTKRLIAAIPTRKKRG
jgi:ABC-type dipeptide/oligopeptide/nickel transport system ATPase component